MAGRIVATDAARAAVERLTARYGALMLFQSGGCCDGSSPICMADGELLLGPSDLLLGDVAGASFYIDEDQYRRWHEPLLELDVRPGAAEGFSLEGLDDVHFVTRTRTR